MKSKTTRIVVTAQDIANGKRESVDHCPVALAIKRGTGAGWVEVWTGPARIDFGLVLGGGCGWTATATLTPRMVDWVDAFDDGQKVAPTHLMLVWREENYVL